MKSLGLLQPLPMPDQAWQVVCFDFFRKIVCFDFIEGLPKSNRYDTITVVIDKFTKYGHFVPLAHPYFALQVAQSSYLDNVYKLHGLSQSILSNRDRIFTSTVWRELFRLTNTQLMISSSYHPQTNGQTERLNQCLETFLRCSVSSGSGANTFQSPSFGIIHHSIQRWGDHRLNSCMGIPRNSWEFSTQIRVTHLSWSSGCGSATY